jgi:hypothetical protein
MALKARHGTWAHSPGAHTRRCGWRLRLPGSGYHPFMPSAPDGVPMLAAVTSLLQGTPSAGGRKRSAACTSGRLN